MMQRNKRMLSALTSAALILSLLGGCGDAKSPTDDPASETTNVPPASAAMSIDELLNANWDDIEAQAKAEGKLTFFAWSDEAFWIELKNAFETKYGIQVEVVIADQGKAFDKVLAEKDHPKGSFDLMMMGGSSVNLCMGADLLAGPLVPKMRTADKLEPQLCERVEGIPTNGFTVPAKTNQSGLLYNPRTVSELPQTWADLEKWIDANPMKLGFCIPEKGGSGQAFVHSLLGEMTGGLEQYYNDSEVDPAKTENWGAMWDWLNSRKDKITFTASNNDSISRLNQGELDIVAAWDDNAYRVMKNGELFNDAKMYIPEFGMPGGGDVMGIPKNTQNPAAALLMADFIVSDEGQQLFIDVLKCGPARTDMENPNTFLTSEDLARRIPWIPSVYKTQFVKGFTSEVMMSK